MTKKEISLLILLAAINFTNIMDFMIMMPLQEFLEASFNITPKQFGLLVSAYAFSAFAASMTASFMVDRLDRKHVLLVAFAGLIVGTFGCGIATSYPMLMASRIVAGLFGGLIGAQALSIVGDVFPYEKRGRAMGLLMSGFALATIAGVPVGLYIANKTNWQVPFIGIAVLGVILCIIAFISIPNMKAHIDIKRERNIFRVYQSVGKDRNQQFALLMMMTLIFSHFAAIPFIAPYLTKNTGFLQEQLPLMYFFGGISSLFVSPLVGKLSDKFGKHKVFTAFMLLAIIPVYFLTNLGHVSYYYVLVVTTLFFIVAGGRMVPAQALVTSVVPPDLRGGFMNLNASLQQLSLGLASFIGGMIISKNAAGELQHYEIIGYMSIALSMVCLFITWKVKAVDLKEVEHLEEEKK
jgi:MFS transporter, DHA1 family, inner membrane transport protein